MYRSSADQIFDLLSRVRGRAVELVTGQGAGAPDGPIYVEREAAALATQVELRLPHLSAAFEMSALGTDLVVCLLAAEYDPYLRTVVRATQRELGRPWLEVGTLAELLRLSVEGIPEIERLIAPSSPLVRYAIVELDETSETTPVVATRVKLTSRVARYLIGDDVLPDGIRLVDSDVALGESLVPQAQRDAALGLLERAIAGGGDALVELAGPAGAGKKFFAGGLARALDRPLLVGDLKHVRGHEITRRLADVAREARLYDALPCIDHLDATFLSRGPGGAIEDANPSEPAAREIPRAVERFLESLRGPALVTLSALEPRLSAMTSGRVLSIELPFPSPSQRASLLCRAVATHDKLIEAGVDPANLVRRFALTPGGLVAAARTASESAEDRGEQEITRVELIDACRRQLRHDLQSLAVRVTNSHKWEDLVIPVDVYEGLNEMIAYMRHARRVYEDWGFGARHSLSQGVSALFAGPPGTGKTMSASVMARELDMELFRVDLSRVVSKWIGETEKNLGKVFDEAQRSNAIILFDEADSLFSKRTDVKSSVDRYANLEVNFLLQRMENFGGVTILTTNFEDTIDTAFKRRLSFRLRYEKPDANARAALWAKMFPEGASLSPDLDYQKLGESYEMSGGNIRNAAVRAAFMAAERGTPIDMEMCLVAAEKESREMGLLTRSASTPDADNDSPSTPKDRTGDSAQPPRLVPITRPRQ